MQWHDPSRNGLSAGVQVPSVRPGDALGAMFTSTFSEETHCLLPGHHMLAMPIFEPGQAEGPCAEFGKVCDDFVNIAFNLAGTFPETWVIVLPDVLVDPEFRLSPIPRRFLCERRGVPKLHCCRFFPDSQ